MKSRPSDDPPPAEAAAVTRLLARIRSGDRYATDELIPLVYDQLRQLAERHLNQERLGHTLQPTALAHEAYLRLVGPGESWENRAHFFGAASRAIRRILVEHARGRARLKRGGDRARVDFEDIEPEATLADEQLLVLDEALARLAEGDEQKARVVELRFFGGLSEKEVAEVIGVSERTVSRAWQFARAWLRREMGG